LGEFTKERENKKKRFSSSSLLFCALDNDSDSDENDLTKKL